MLNELQREGLERIPKLLRDSVSPSAGLYHSWIVHSPSLQLYVLLHVHDPSTFLSCIQQRANFLDMSSMRAVPAEGRRNLLFMSGRMSKFRGGWVRVTRGLYAGDVGFAVGDGEWVEVLLPLREVRGENKDRLADNRSDAGDEEPWGEDAAPPSQPGYIPAGVNVNALSSLGKRRLRHEGSLMSRRPNKRAREDKEWVPAGKRDLPRLLTEEELEEVEHVGDGVTWHEKFPELQFVDDLARIRCRRHALVFPHDIDDRQRALFEASCCPRLDVATLPEKRSVTTLFSVGERVRVLRGAKALKGTVTRIHGGEMELDVGFGVTKKLKAAHLSHLSVGTAVDVVLDVGTVVAVENGTLKVDLDGGEEALVTFRQVLKEFDDFDMVEVVVDGVARFSGWVLLPDAESRLPASYVSVVWRRVDKSTGNVRQQATHEETDVYAQSIVQVRKSLLLVGTTY